MQQKIFKQCKMELISGRIKVYKKRKGDSEESPEWCKEHQHSICRSNSTSTDALIKKQDLIVKAFFAMFRNDGIVLILKNEPLSL
jgi:hypothetical protein